MKHRRTSYENIFRLDPQYTHSITIEYKDSNSLEMIITWFSVEPILLAIRKCLILHSARKLNSN